MITVVSVARFCGVAAIGQAAGTLTPRDASYQPIRIRAYHVAVYTLPLPPRASLSEVTIYAGDKAIHGEVLPRQQADQVYREERDRGHDAGLASQRAFQAFDFGVSPVRAQDTTRIRFVYYQPLDG